MLDRNQGFSTMELQRTMGKMPDSAAYPEKWIGCLGPVAWPPRSPDLSPVGLSSWKHLKGHVYAVLLRSNEDLVAWLQAAVTAVDASILRRDRENAVRRTAAYFERLL
jgi:hypothetical protein